MNRSDLTDKIKKCFGPRIPMEARDQFQAWKNGSESIFINYDWVKDRRIFDWLVDNDVMFNDGEQGVIITMKN